LVLWFHKLGSPPWFDRFAARWAPWALLAGALVMAPGVWGALFDVPPDYQQGDSFRILSLHVPAAWLSMLVFGIMAIQATIDLVWRIKLCEVLAMACAPIGAAFTLITLLTGSIWGKPMWGTWWDWDPRMTTELILLFLYLGVIGLYNAIDDRRAAARAAGLLAILGVVLLPIIRYSVEWWDSLHQGQTIRVLGLAVLVDGDRAQFLVRRLAAAAGARRQPAARGWQGLGRGHLRRHRRNRRAPARRGSPMSYLGYVVAAYAVFVVVLAWDVL